MHLIVKICTIHISRNYNIVRFAKTMTCKKTFLVSIKNVCLSILKIPNCKCKLEIKEDKMAPPATSLTVTTSGNIVDEVFTAFSVRFASLANRRPVFLVNFTVDQISFYIGALGGVGIGYWLSHYDPLNIDNIDYMNQRVDDHHERGIFMDIVNHVMTYPFKIIHRFFFSGTLYVLIGLATGRMIKQDGFGRPLVCGSLTGLFLSNGSSLEKTLKGVLGFAAFSTLMETALSYVLG